MAEQAMAEQAMAEQAMAGDGVVGEDVPLERVETEITTLSGQIAAATALLLSWIAEYDRRQGWASWGCRSCAQWLSWKCGDDLHTAREKVRVARALEALPEISGAFAAGELSFSKVRAITRVAVPSDDADWVEQARHATGSQLERIVAKVRDALDNDEAGDARRGLEQRRATRKRRGAAVSAIEVSAPDDLIDTVWAAVDVLASRQIDEACAGTDKSRRETIAERGGIAAVRADALREMAERILADDPAGATRGDVGRLSLVAELEAIQEVATDEPDSRTAECTLGGRRVAPEVARRMACDIVGEVVLETADSHGCDVGRDTRIVSRKLRRALHRRDNGMCRFPGCGASSWLHAHHIVHWADGGETVLANLVSLCGFHHQLVHEGGWQVVIAQGAVIWSDPEGVPTTVEPLRGSVEGLVKRVGHAVMAEPSLGSQPIDFGFVVSVLAEHCARKRRPRDQRAAVSMSSPMPM